ncbi:phycobiliprotein lyase [Gloeocapsa sp. PCC 73106]|uniref:phycobiliprotein lyase n=1 Tax=Gloeocapsa sp. PCC 73106 TaxID=102232 RepID=UPI0002ACB9F0|nr:phycobiliprotein lyase [Gloeocapsa sp. PCC 73106]ELR96967.1 CpcV protein [Gloeocapsa sp. PCC 73106]
MTLLSQIQVSTVAQAIEFFRSSQGDWKSQRRYYTLTSPVDPQEVISYLQIRFLESDAPELTELAQLHQISNEFAGGSEVKWESNYVNQVRKLSQGLTIFGIKDNFLYRDRGFATSKPVKAIYTMPNSDTLCLRTEYNKSVFEEELKLVGNNYRTRQTIISQAGEEQMIGQYLETRL